jgi:hypothetical protein
VSDRRRLLLFPEATGAEVLLLRRSIRAHLLQSPGSVIECVVLDGHVDLRTVEAVARLQLTARRAGGCIRLAGPPRLAELLLLTGVAAAAGLRVQVIGQPKEREEAGGVQEEGDAADPIA